jgi:hypothetical protein
VGAGYGAILGAGSGETTDERIDNAKKGALIGGLLGAGAPVAGSAVGGVAGRVRDAVAPMPRELQPYARGAVDRMATAFEHDAPGNTATFGSEGMLADLGEPLEAARARMPKPVRYTGRTLSLESGVNPDSPFMPGWWAANQRRFATVMMREHPERCIVRQMEAAE